MGRARAKAGITEPFAATFGSTRGSEGAQTLSASRMAVPAHKRGPMTSKDALELFGDGWEARQHDPIGLRLSTGILSGGPYVYMETIKGFGGPRLAVSEATQLRDALSKWLAEDCKECGHPNADHADGIDPLLPPYSSE